MKDEQQKLVSIEDAVFELRMLLLLETNPQSNRYSQLLLTEKQYHQINEFIKSLLPKCKNPLHNQAICVSVYLENKYDIQLNSEIRAHYLEEEIKKESAG